MRKNIILLTLILLLSTAISAQKKTTEQPIKPTQEKPVKKSNQRPTTASLKEKFDNADVKTMANQCVKLETEPGNIELEMFPESAPESVRNFLNLTSIGAFNTTTFSRVVPGFIVQGGNIATRETRTNEMTKRAYRNIPDEPSLIKHERGIVSMARGDEPNSASSNFFILLSDGTHLDGTFAAFGRVINGMEVVEAISKMPVENEKPEKPVRVKTATIIPCTTQTKE